MKTAPVSPFAPSRRLALRAAAWAWLVSLGACAAELEGIAKSQDAATTVVLDFEARPLPNIPLPNDLATRYDPSSSTGRRINASMVAPTSFERRVRTLVDGLDGWGAFSPISVPFSGLIDLDGLRKAHVGDDYATADDVVYVLDITRGSPTYGEPVIVDAGSGNFPIALEKLDSFWPHDPRGDTNSLLFEEHDEDSNGNGVLDEGEDSDLDGVLDVPNYHPAVDGDLNGKDLAQRADALMTHYERETNTLILRPLRPMRQRTTYAVVVTRRLKDALGQPVGSPFPWVHHLGQTDALQPLVSLLDGSRAALGNLKLADVAFAWTFTTGTMTDELVAVRDGLYGHGVQSHFATEFPAELEILHKVWTDKPAHAWETPYTLSSESFLDLNAVLDLVSTKGEEGKRAAVGSRYVDYHAFGSFQSPQLFDRVDAEGNPLDYNEMVWPQDVHTRRVQARGERIGFWVTVPRKEVSARKDGKPTQVAIVGHGYTSSKFEVLVYHHILARHGIAAISIDCAGHGLVLPTDYQVLAPAVLKSMGMEGVADAVLQNRAYDQNADGEADSGADFWTAYTFHTRDNVRQSAVDYVQLIRLLRTFDGKHTWAFDANGNGKADDVAGDFDGDGFVDVGGPDVTYGMFGSSLGGIMSGMLAGLEPTLSAVVPIAGGAGLGDVGIRSIQGGVKEAVELRMMGPLYVGHAFGSHPADAKDKDGVQGEVVVRTIIPDLNGTGEREVARVPADVIEQVKGGSVLAENLDNGARDCARIGADGSFRVALASDTPREPEPSKYALNPKLAVPDEDAVAEAANAAALSAARFRRQKHRLTFYPGMAFQTGVIEPASRAACELKPGVKPVHTLDKFGKRVIYHAFGRKQIFEEGSTLAPLAEGLGLHRARPEIRRFMGFAQLVLDAGDPAIWAAHSQSGEIVYGDGSKVASNLLVWHNVGDMNVPASTGAAMARAAGLIDWTTPVPAWGDRTVNQVLIDGHMLEAVDKIPRYKAPDGTSVPMDPENLSSLALSSAPSAVMTEFIQAPGKSYETGPDGYALPRLSPPLHTHAVKARGEGVSGFFMPLVDPDGEHDPPAPGRETDRQRKACVNAATAAGQDPGPCETKSYFDSGSVVFEMLATYLKTGGKEFRLQACQSDWSCTDVPAPPALRKD